MTELVESIRIRDQFLSTLSHELRTPINAIVGLLDVLAADLDHTSDLGQLLLTVRDSALKLTDRVSNLLLAGSADKIVIQVELADVTTIVSEVLDGRSLDAKNRSIDFNIHPMRFGPKLTATLFESLSII